LAKKCSKKSIYQVVGGKKPKKVGRVLSANVSFAGAKEKAKEYKDKGYTVAVYRRAIVSEKERIRISHLIGKPYKSCYKWVQAKASLIGR